MKRAVSYMILALCFLLISGSRTDSFAALEERDDPDWGIGSITYDSGTGLEWLDVNLSTNLTYNYVSDQFGQGGYFEGFRYATHQEVLDLIDEADISIIDLGSTDPNHVNACQNFIDLVGSTDNINGYDAVRGVNGTVPPYVNDMFRMSLQVQAGLTSTGDVWYIADTMAYFSVSLANQGFGHWLVREALVDPEVMLQQLSDFVISLNIKQGISNSFDAKLSSALQALDDLNENNDVAAINSLNAFINAVEAQSGKAITEIDADELISKAQAIIDLLSQ